MCMIYYFQSIMKTRIDDFKKEKKEERVENSTEGIQALEDGTLRPASQ